MKKKIAFLDLFIDEWHANHYPLWFSQAPRGNEFELVYAWEKKTFPGRRELKAWCADMNMTPADSLQEAVDKSDCICVLAPANPEVHEELADYALASGKPVYIDKPFAPSKAVAQRIFETAEKHGTPLMSSSALRFGDELLKGDIKAAQPGILRTTGGGSSYHEYAIHQLEMIVSSMGTEVEKVMATGNGERASVVLEYSDNRLATLAYAPSYPFAVTAAGREQAFVCPQLSHTFENLTAAILDFFATGVSSVPKEETITIAGLLEQTVNMIERQ